jgi:hypothetical protein
MCDASAAVALDNDRIVVADDELNILRIYSRAGGRPTKEIDLSSFLDTAPDKESDLEGAAQIGGLIFWISSHGRNSQGEAQKRRLRFFATEPTNDPGGPTLRPVGRAYSGLLNDLLSEPSFAKYRLREASELAPEADGGLNIEGLASSKDGSLLIGFRNPVRNGDALLAPLLNPGEVVQGQMARFGTMIELDLGGRGVRSIEYDGSRYLIVAGPTNDGTSFALYGWSGQRFEAPKLIPSTDIADLSPEALFFLPGSSSFQLMSDDGARKVNGVRCKDLKQDEQSFRAIGLP